MQKSISNKTPAAYSTQVRISKRNLIERTMRLLMLLSIFLLAACGGGGGGGADSSPTYGAPVPNTVSGTVMFKGAPLPGVTITVFNNNSNPSTVFAIATTDANGNYSIPGLPTGWDATPNFSFVATKAGYAFNPFIASNPTGNRTNYLWDPLPQTWYVNTGANAIRAGFNGVFSNPNGGSAIMFNVINFNSLTNEPLAKRIFGAFVAREHLIFLANFQKRASQLSCINV